MSGPRPAGADGGGSGSGAAAASWPYPRSPPQGRSTTTAAWAATAAAQAQAQAQVQAQAQRYPMDGSSLNGNDGDAQPVSPPNGVSSPAAVPVPMLQRGSGQRVTSPTMPIPGAAAAAAAAGMAGSPGRASPSSSLHPHHPYARRVSLADEQHQQFLRRVKSVPNIDAAAAPARGNAAAGGAGQFLPEHLALLEEVFAQQPTPNAQVRDSLAARLGTSPHAVHSWFQHRRLRGPGQPGRASSRNAPSPPLPPVPYVDRSALRRVCLPLL